MDSNRQEIDEEVEIDLLELAEVLWSKAVFIIAVAVIVAVGVFLVEKLFVTPQYTSTTKMLVLSRQNEGTLSSGDMSTSTSLTQDYVELIQTREVTESTIQHLGLSTSSGEEMTHEQLLSKIDVEQTTSTRIITISVEDPDPEQAQLIANTVRELAAEHIKNVTDTEAVNVADYANLPEVPSSPHKLRDTVIGGAAGFILACAVVLAMHLMDNTIKSSEDVERYLGISTLGTLPVQEGDQKKEVSAWLRRTRK